MGRELFDSTVFDVVYSYTNFIIGTKLQAQYSFQVTGFWIKPGKSLYRGKGMVLHLQSSTNCGLGLFFSKLTTVNLTFHTNGPSSAYFALVTIQKPDTNMSGFQINASFKCLVFGDSLYIFFLYYLLDAIRFD
jgi:hypothetical protein